MRDRKTKFNSFLKKLGFLPLSRWNYFELEHGKKAIFKNNKAKIGEEVDRKSGIYVYKKGKRTLYIGKAASLPQRLTSHNRESFEAVSGDTKQKTWHKFFSRKDNIGVVKIFWEEVNLEVERQILEKMLQHTLNPEFECFRRKLERKK